MFQRDEICTNVAGKEGLPMHKGHTAPFMAMQDE